MVSWILEGKSFVVGWRPGMLSGLLIVTCFGEAPEGNRIARR